MMLHALQRELSAKIRSDSEGLDNSWPGPGLQVYRNTYRAQLITCLERTFPRLHCWLGKENFLQAVLIHIRAIPPSSWTLDAYSRDFPNTMAALYRNQPEATELAWLDLALSEAFVAPDAEPARTEGLCEIDWDAVGIAFVPSLDIAPARTNAALIWNAVASGKIPPKVQLLDTGAAHIVWRHEFVPRFRVIDALEHHSIISLRAGVLFREFCSGLTAEFGKADGVLHAGQMLGRWIADGMVASVPVRQIRAKGMKL